MKTMRNGKSLLVLLTVLALLVGCASFDEKQGEWIFQPTERTWGGAGAAQGMDDVWIEFDSRLAGRRVRLHALWLAADPAAHTSAATAPVLLYLHGARWNVESSAFRARHMQQLGFSVLALDYRGFGKSDAATPSEALAQEDAHAAWDWLRAHHPSQLRYIFGHSLGAAVAISLASQVQDEAGTIVEGAFTSLPDVLGTMKWGWLPVSLVMTQRFEAIKQVTQIGSPLLVVHGADDGLIRPELGRRLFDAAREPKAFVLVKGGSHHTTNAVGQDQYRQAIAQLFGLR